MHICIFTHSTQHDFPIFCFLCLSHNNNKVKLCRLSHVLSAFTRVNVLFYRTLIDQAIRGKLWIVITNNRRKISELNALWTLNDAWYSFCNRGQHFQINQFSIHVILRLYCKKNDADIRRSKNCLKVHRIASLLNRKACISAPNNSSWRRVKAFKSRIEQKTGLSETMRNVVQMDVENEFFMFLSLLFCNNKSAAPFINFLSRHETFVEFLFSFDCWRVLLLFHHHVWSANSICFPFKRQRWLKLFWTLIQVWSI